VSVSSFSFPGSAALSNLKLTWVPLSSLVKEPEGLIAVQAHLTQLGDMEEDKWPASLQEFLA